MGCGDELEKAGGGEGASHEHICGHEREFGAAADGGGARCWPQLTVDRGDNKANGFRIVGLYVRWSADANYDEVGQAHLRCV